MKTMFNLSLKNIKENKKWAFMTVIGISISMMLITMVISIGMGTYQSVKKDYLHSSQSWNVRLSSTSLDTILSRDRISEIETILENNENVERYLVSSNLGTYGEPEGIYFISVSDFNINYNQNEGRGPLSYEHSGVIEGREPQNDTEIVMSKQFDQSSLPDMGDVIEIHMHNGTSKNFVVVGYSNGGSNQVINQENLSFVDVYVEYKDGVDFKGELAKLNEFSEFDNRAMNSTVNSLRGFTIPTNKLFIAAISLLVLIVLIIALSSMSLIYNAFFLSLEQKVQQIGLLKSIGATNKQISSMVYFEGFILTILSISLGIAGGYLLAYQSLEFIGMTYTSIAKELTRFKPVISIELIFAIYIVGLITVIFPLRKSVKYANRVSPVETIRNIQANDDKLKIKKVPNLIERFLGLNGVLAFKNYYRDRKKHRSTGIALVVTIVLFISISSFMNYGRVAIDAATDVHYDVSFDTYGSSGEFLDDYNDIKSRYKETLPEGSFLEYRNAYLFGTYSQMPLPLAEEFKKYNTHKLTNNISSMLVVLKDDMFVEYFGEENLNKTIMSNHQTGTIEIKRTEDWELVEQIYVDSNVTDVVEGSKFEFGFNVKPEEENQEYNHIGIDIPIDLVLDKIDLKVPNSSSTFEVNIFTSESKVADLGLLEILEDGENILRHFFKITTKEHERVEKELKTLANEGDYKHGKSLAGHVYNKTRENLVLVSVMGSLDVATAIILGFIALICLSNMLNVLQSSSRQRQKEFGILRSVGMKTKDLRSMVLIESVLNSIMPAILGVLGGIGISYLMYYLLRRGLFLGDFQLDATSILISVGLILFIQLIQIISSIALLKRSNIVQDLKRMEM